MNWKNIGLTALIVLLVVVLALLAFRALEPQAERDLKNRIKQYKVIKEEQQLACDILKLKYEIAVIQSKFTPAPVPNRPVVEAPQVKE